MIDETLLADPRRCPSCAALLRPPVTACPACHLPLSGPTAGRLWTVSTEAARLLGERARLVGALRAEAERPPSRRTSHRRPVRAGAAPAAARPAGRRHPAAPEWTPRRVQNLLLALGVGLLGVAAVIFVAVSWGRLGVGGRAAVLTGVTALAFLGARTAHRRGLTATAEALSLLTVGLALLDCGGAWAADLFGLRDGRRPPRRRRLRRPRRGARGCRRARRADPRRCGVSAAVLGQLPVPLLAVHLADTLAPPRAVLAAAATLQTVALLGLAWLWPAGRRTDDARVVVGAGGGVAAGAVAVALSLGTAYGEDGSLVVGTALLLVLRRPGRRRRRRCDPRRSAAADGPAGLAAALAVAAVWAPVVDAVAGRWTAVALAGAAAALLARRLLVPAARRLAPGAVLLAAARPPRGRCPRADLGDGVTERLENVHLPWSTGLDDPTLVTTADWERSPSSSLVAAVVALAPLVLPQVGRGASARVVPAAGALWLAPAAVHAGYRTTLVRRPRRGAHVLLAAGVVALTRRDRGLVATTLAPAAGVLGLACVWSLAVEPATLVVLPVAAAVLAAGAAAALRGR